MSIFTTFIMHVPLLSWAICLRLRIPQWFESLGVFGKKRVTPLLWAGGWLIGRPKFSGIYLPLFFVYNFLSYNHYETPFGPFGSRLVWLLSLWIPDTPSNGWGGSVVGIWGIPRLGSHTKWLPNGPNGVSLWLYDKILPKKMWQGNPQKFGTPYCEPPNPKRKARNPDFR